MERRQNYSRKREAILKIVQGTKVHPRLSGSTTN